jgi:alkylated DNA nucleotide flippase Atl1
MANHTNPIPIVIPCHRVIAANGTLCGYGGGLETKRYLLRLEGAAFREPASGQQASLFDGDTGVLAPAGRKRKHAA